MLRPYATSGLPLSLLRHDLHLDLPRLRLLRLGERHGENAVLVARLDVARIHGRGQGEAALEGAIGPLIAVHPLGALLGDLLLRALDREDVVLERELHVLGFDTGHLRDDADRLGVLEDVHGRHPRGLRAVAVEAAQHVEDPVDHRVSLEGAGAARGRVRGEGRAGVSGAARSGWGGDRAARVGGCGGQDPGARLHPVLRSGAGSLPLDAPPRNRGGGRLTAVGERFAVRVMVTDVWDQVFLAVEPTTTVAELKRQALTQALKRAQVRPEDYVVKFRGAQVLDETTTLAALGAVPNSPFIVLPARRHPVR